MNTIKQLELDIEGINVNEILSKYNLAIDNIRLIVACKNCHHSWAAVIWGIHDLDDQKHFTCVRCGGGVK
jgi:hypothetical protein